jgi:hypothetical protein
MYTISKFAPLNFRFNALFLRFTKRTPSYVYLFYNYWSHGLLTCNGLFSLLCILCSLLFCDIYCSLFLLLFIALVLCYPN